jgi:hypothetical protein
MSEGQQHTNPWAEKLSQVSLPDGRESWEAMEAVLDKQMPVGRRRDRRRWFLLILLLLLLIGVCNCPGRKWVFAGKTRTSRVVPGGSQVQHGPSAGGEVQVRGGRTEGVVRGAGESVVGPRPGNSPDGSAGVKKDRVSRDGKVDSGDKTGTEKEGRPERTGTDKKRITGKTGTEKKRITGKTDTAQNRRPGGRKAGTTGTTPDVTTGVTQDTATESQPKTIAGTPGRAGKTGAPGAGKTGTLGIAKTSPSPDKAKKKEETKKKDAEKKKADSVKNIRWGALVVGIGLNQFFTVGSQETSSWNSGGITGTLGDYIPVPMVRYYFDSNLYVQIEAQFNTPQYTRKDLVAESTPTDSVGLTTGGAVITQQQTVAINKLFYFNVPLSVHYTVYDHLDLGAGLQYSRLTNGVGVFTTNYGQNGVDTATSTNTKSFRGDSVYKEIKTHEFRFLVDANYNWKHFIVGVRYNQALSKFIHVEISPGQVTQARNSSLQLYLRYILWDGRKKRASLSPAK